MIGATKRPSVLYRRLSDFISAVDGSLESNQWLLARCLGLLSTGLPIQVNSFKILISFEKHTYVLHYRANITSNQMMVQTSVSTGRIGTGPPIVPMSRDKKFFTFPKNRKKDVLKQEKDILKQEKDVLKQERML